MKRLITFLILLAVACLLKAQVSTENYIRTRRMTNEAGTSYMDRIDYYDALGRPFQQVWKATQNGTAVNKNRATLQEYDLSSRLTHSWLPAYAGSSAYVAPSSFKDDAPASRNNDSRPYIQTVYEASPLNRPIQQYGAGAAWYSGNHSNRSDYQANVATAGNVLACKRYTTNGTSLSGGTGYYPANTLAVLQSTDEDGHVSYTFTDRLGRTVLVRQLEGGTQHDTYYVYDSRDNLCFVLQPEYQTVPDPEKYAFQYKYDGYGRCTEKTIPGAGTMRYDYDAADRVIFSQDGNLNAKNHWMYYEYDDLDRLTERGECNGKDKNSKTVWIKNYYDNYDFLSQAGFNNSHFPADNTGYGKGYLTGSEITVPGTTTKLYTAYYYDIKGRVTKTVQSNLQGGYDVTTTTYTFTDRPLTVTHTNTASGKSTLTEVYTYTYDYEDRLTQVQHKLGDAQVTLATYTYDNLGRLQTRNLHGSATNQLTYSYNIRDWLTGISGTKFTQELFYVGGVGTPCYNGNISSMTWRSGDETALRGYRFTYDGLNRLTLAKYGENPAMDRYYNIFNEQVTGYDKNGNILGLQRYGQVGAGDDYGLIDDLTYTLNGNQLSRVDDAAGTAEYNGGFEFRDAVQQADEYDYDYNGNLTKDLNRGIDTITYNFLNLPSKVEFTDGSTIEYVYAADGAKLRTKHTIGGTTTTTDYCGDVIYEDGTRKYLLTEEGYVTLADNKYHYYLKDHQGNNRVVIASNGTVEETNHYYPFGGLFASTTSVQPYKYNGKEFDTKKGLNWYDYGARHYDPSLGRFTTMDPMAESYYAASTYAYCGNNPVNRIDPNGMDWYQNNETKYYTWYEERLKREGYTYIGGKGSVLGEFEPIIDDILTGVFNRESLYSEGFTFDIVPNDKGALIGSDERGWNFLDEFVNGTGPELSVFMSDHPYTEAMKSAKDVLEGQQRIANGDTDVPGQITNVQASWGLWDVITTPSMAKQFIGSYRFDAFTNKDGNYLNNVISDSKSMSSLLYHLYPSSRNPNRAQQKIMGTTYQFYIWQSKK